PKIPAWEKGSVVVGGDVAALHQQHFAQQARAFADALLDRGRNRWIVLEELAGILAPLPQALAVPGEPGAGLLDDAGLDAQIEQFTGLGNALAIHDVEFDLTERR